MRIHVVGKNIEIPAAWRDAPETQNRVIYSLPDRLLALVYRDIDLQAANSQEVLLERQVLKNFDPTSTGIAGFLFGTPIQYLYLAPHKPISFDDADTADLGKNQAEANHIARLANAAVEVFENQIRDYLGWLLSQKSFLTEHHTIIKRYAKQIRTVGFPVLSGSPPVPLKSHSDEEIYIAEMQTFFSRWRLKTLAAPYLPIPHAPQLPNVSTPGFGVTEGVEDFTIPDIFATNSRGILPEIVEAALRNNSRQEHLADWMKIVSQANSARNPIIAFVRRFQVQHYWRVLLDRFPNELHRKKGRMTEAFADFFEVSVDSIKRDLRYFIDNLGEAWEREFITTL